LPMREAGVKQLRREAIHILRVQRLRILGVIVPRPACVHAMHRDNFTFTCESHAVGGNHIRVKTAYG